MGYAADNRATVAYLHVADMLDRLHQEWMFFLHECRTFNLALTYGSADREIPILGFNIMQFGKVVDIHDVSGPCQAHIEQRHETLAAC